jgi:chromosome segregation protein
VEAALGGAFKYVVVDDEKAAAECIRLLKKNRWGRVTFMPITAIRPSSLSEQERQLLGGEQFTIAASVIRCEAKYADIMKNILGRVLFVEDMRRAEALSKHTKNRFKIVTLGGEVFMPGGSIVGGEAKSDNPAPMMRKRRIDELERAIEVSRKTYEEKIQLNGGLKGELEESKQELDSLRASIAEKNVALAASDAGVRNCAQQLKSLQEQLEELGDKRAQTIEQKRFLEEQLEGNRDVEEIKSACRAEEEQLNELRLKAATLDEKKINIAGQAMKYAQEISALTHRREESAEKVAQLNARMIELKQLLSTEEVHNADYERRRDALKQSYEELTRAKAEKSELYDKANRDVVTLSKEKNDINDDLNRLLIKINNAQIKMEHLQQAMLEQYQITAEEAGQYKRPIENVELYAAERDELKQKITSLGNINVGALEEYEEVSQRYEFLIAQRDDLIAAKADIESIIEDIEKSMAEQFKARFGLIQQEFDVAFKKLFRGGTAEIGIEDEEDLMSTGIVISAQPPGKKLKNMNMLSGGEKALTAIALLFAILKIKPAPFCVLDEIDAALDENNVVRLTEYIDEMRKSNQFIIITHKRRTMEICDCIYGASMGSDGVTQIISLKLDRETEEAI